MTFEIFIIKPKQTKVSPAVAKSHILTKSRSSMLIGIRKCIFIHPTHSVSPSKVRNIAGFLCMIKALISDQIHFFYWPTLNSDDTAIIYANHHDLDVHETMHPVNNV